VLLRLPGDPFDSGRRLSVAALRRCLTCLTMVAPRRAHVSAAVRSHGDPQAMNRNPQPIRRPRPNDRKPPLADITEVAALLAVDVRHVRRLVFERRIPFIKWGHLLRFDVDELVEWIDQARVPTQADSTTGRTTPGRSDPLLRAASSE